MGVPGHTFLIRWLILLGLLATATVVAWHQGVFHLLLNSDPTRISIAIVSLFAVMTAHAGWRVGVLSREIGAAQSARAMLERHPGRALRLDAARVHVGPSEPLPRGWLHDHAAQVLRKYAGAGPVSGAVVEESRLLNAFEQRVRARQEVGWLLADLMIKLGLLGTVVGFILMLGTVTGLDELDLTTVQRLLSEMSGGMRVALFTTMCGLVGGTLLGLQYHIADRAVAELVATVTEVTEVEIVPRLAVTPGDEGAGGHPRPDPGRPTGPPEAAAMPTGGGEQR